MYGTYRSQTAVPESAVAPALALERPPDADVQVGEAKGRQVVSAREMRGVVRGHAAARSAVQGVTRRASRSRKKGCYGGDMSVNSTHSEWAFQARHEMASPSGVAGLETLEADDAGLPVNVLGRQQGNLGQARPQVPRDFGEQLALRVPVRGHNLFVFASG
jgi:hypothetical protein